MDRLSKLRITVIVPAEQGLWPDEPGELMVPAS